jgi:hypothetical protein
MFLAFAQVALNLLGETQYLARCLLRQTEHRSIHERMVRLEAPGLRLDERRLSDNLSYPLVDQPDGLAEVFFTLAKVGAQTEVHLMLSHRE